jgi:hypothetical protein
MSSERQIAANRRNAQKSTGPRSAAGKQRASANAYRHGFAAGIGHCDKSAQIERLALDMIGAATGSFDAATDAEILEFGRVAAKAELDIAYLRRAKAATMNSLMAVTRWQEAAVSQTAENPAVAISGTSEQSSKVLREPAAPTLPSLEPSELMEATRNSLATLVTIERYERRATARRDRAVLQIIARAIFGIQSWDVFGRTNPISFNASMNSEDKY